MDDDENIQDKTLNDIFGEDSDFNDEKDNEISTEYVGVLKKQNQEKVNYKSLDGEYESNELIEAIENEKFSKAKKMIKKGRKVDEKDRRDKTPLIATIETGSMKLMRMLVEKGVYVNRSDEGVLPSLMAAIKHDELDIVAFLIENGADVNNLIAQNVKTVEDIFGETNCRKTPNLTGDIDSSVSVSVPILLKAIELSRFDAVDMLIDKGVDINQVDELGRSSLMYACFKGDLDLVKKLLELGVDLNRKDKVGCNSLIYAIQSGSVEVVDYQGVKINVRNKETGKLTLMYAVSGNNCELIERLIQAGVDIDVKKDNGINSLMYGVINENYEVVDKLIDCGAALNATDNDGMSALMYLVKVKEIGDLRVGSSSLNQKEYNLVEKMIQNGVNVDIVNNSGETALDYAKKRDDEKLIKLLSQHTSKFNLKKFIIYLKNKLN